MVHPLDVATSSGTGALNGAASFAEGMLYIRKVYLWWSRPTSYHQVRIILHANSDFATRRTSDEIRSSSSALLLPYLREELNLAYDSFPFPCSRLTGNSNPTLLIRWQHGRSVPLTTRYNCAGLRYPLCMGTYRSIYTKKRTLIP